MTAIDDHAGRVEAAFLGALAGERAAHGPAAAGDLLEVAASIAHVGGFDAEDLRRRGLAGTSQAGASGLLLRAIPFALQAPLDRPRLRRNAYRVASLAGADEGTAVAAVAAALLAADLIRFDLASALIRVRQSLLEDAPFALLDRIAPAPPDRRPATDEDSGAALQLAISALSEADGIEAVVAAASGSGRHAAVSLAGALAGARSGLAGIDPGWREGIPHAGHAASLAHAVLAVSARAEPPATPETEAPTQPQYTPGDG